MRLSKVLREYRWATKQGVRELALELGFSHATLSRIERGEDPSGPSLAKILIWMFYEETP